jgi:carboxymethylenebutenolidase
MNMSEHVANVQTRDGDMEVFVARAQDPAPLAVVLCMDVWGVREELRDIARSIARLGYYCVLPDFFHREGTVRHDFRDANGRAMTLASLTPEQQEAVRGPMRRLTDEQAMADLTDIFHTALLPQLKFAAIGYCMGGRHALVAGGAFPEQVIAAASLHGSFLVRPDDDSPHWAAARIRGEAYCGFAELDPFAAPHVIAALRSAFEEQGASLRYNVHTGASHGYALPERDVYDPAATARDWAEIEALLTRSCARISTRLSA